MDRSRSLDLTVYLGPDLVSNIHSGLNRSNAFRILGLKDHEMNFVGETIEDSSSSTEVQGSRRT